MNNSNDARIITSMSILLATLNGNCLIIARISSINKILKIFEPAMLQTAITAFLL